MLLNEANLAGHTQLLNFRLTIGPILVLLAFNHEQGRCISAPISYSEGY